MDADDSREATAQDVRRVLGRVALIDPERITDKMTLRMLGVRSNVTHARIILALFDGVDPLAIPEGFESSSATTVAEIIDAVHAARTRFRPQK